MTAALPRAAHPRPARELGPLGEALTSQLRQVTFLLSSVNRCLPAVDRVHKAIARCRSARLIHRLQLQMYRSPPAALAGVATVPVSECQERRHDAVPGLPAVPG